MNQFSPRTLIWSLLVIGIIPFYINGYVNAHIARWPVAYWGFELLCWVVIPILVFMALARYGGMGMPEIGLHGLLGKHRKIELIVLMCLIFSPLAYLIYKLALGYFRTILPDTGIFHYDAVIPPAGITRTLVTVYFALTAGIVEELYFRGLLFKACSYSSHAVPLYLLISPLFFALMHWENGAANVAATYVFGLVYAVVFVVIRNLWPLVVSHTFTDYASFS